jgi:hypothetical protein
MTQRSGYLQADCITLIVMPDELDAMSESDGVAASMSANSLILKSGRSGQFSWTKSTPERAFFMSCEKFSLLRDAVFESPFPGESWPCRVYEFAQIPLSIRCRIGGNYVEATR